MVPPALTPPLFPTSAPPPPCIDSTPVVSPSPMMGYKSTVPSPMTVDPVLAPPLSLDPFTPFDKTRGKKRTLEDATAKPVLMSLTEYRQIAPLKSKRSKPIAMSPILSPLSLPPSRESSPSLDGSIASASSPVKRARTSSISGEISNFSIFASSDDEMEISDPITSPSTRLRARFNQLLGPSPLQKSFSSTAIPQSSRVDHDTSLHPPTLERAVTTPAMAESSKAKTRARTLLSRVEKSEMDDANAEMNKVFMLVLGKGMGMSSTTGGRGFRRGSVLRPKDEETMDLDW